MGDLGEAILRCLSEKEAIDSFSLSSILKEDHQKIIGAIKSLQSLGNVIEAEQHNSKCWELTPEGVESATNGSHEAVLYKSIPEAGISQAELMKTIPNAKVGFSKAMSAGWIQIDKSCPEGPKIFRKAASIDDVVQKQLIHIRNNSTHGITESERQELKKRKLLQETLMKNFVIKKGAEFGVSITKPETDLTPQMIASQSWKTKKFKEYNFNALGVPPVSGYLHPLMKVRTQFRQIFLEMGFTEMPTNNYIESSFWNFDALFQPQQHPARDAHDTFFVSEPMVATDFPMEYLGRVKTVHQTGGYGSQGYKYDWKLEEARKNLLRTHTTANSARLLYQLAQQEVFTPVKYFSIDRVFRNETLDATHLAEFHQIEGVVVDHGLTLGDLIGTLHAFFKKLGITKLKFKPAYNPYTEPSMEIFSYHEGLKKWVEVGNSGLFRPEMLLPMGLPDDVRVLGWGLSLERPTMIKYGIDNIRDLVGHRVNLQMVHENPICRLDKLSTPTLKRDNVDATLKLSRLEERQETILKRLQAMWNEIKEIRETTSNVVNDHVTAKVTKLFITACPSRPVLSLLILERLLDADNIRMTSTVVIDSKTTSRQRSDLLKIYFQVEDPAPGFQMELTWTDSESDVAFVVDGFVEIRGEVNVARYLSRHLTTSYDLEDSDPVTATVIDQWLDVVDASVLHGNNKQRAIALRSLNVHLGKKNWMAGDVHSLADVVMWSALYQTQSVDSAPSNVQRWLTDCAGLRCYQKATKFVEDFY